MPLHQVVAPIRQSSTLRRVAGYALLMGGYALLPVAKEYTRFQGVGDLPSEIHAALTLVLGWLLVFRTNTAYARWWEARTLWGGLVNCCRNIALKTAVLVRLPDETRKELQGLLVAFPYTLRDHLRGAASLEHLVGIPQDAGAPGHIPAFIASQMYERIGRQKQSGGIDGDELRAIDLELQELMDICGACERIRNTRIVGSYRAFARQCVMLFLATLPWGIVRDFGWWTIPLTIITAYFMLGLETVAEHIEEPFGEDEDDLDLDALCETIERTVEQIFQPAAAASRSPAE